MRLFISLLFLAMGNVGLAQYKGPKFPIQDEWFAKYGSKGLHVGDQMPDISLGKVINNTTGKDRFADFRGKLIILDFWATSCVSCIREFPKMEALQREFGDRIQVFLVNPWETDEQIRGRLKKAKLPDLPSIVADSVYKNAEQASKEHPLLKLFPTKATGQYVWIDGDGIIKLRGGMLNNYSEKVRDVLSGKEVFVLNSDATIPTLSTDKKATYYQQLGKLSQTPLVFGSFITPYNNEIAGFKNELIDSIANTKTRYFINTELLDLYVREALSKRLLPQNIIYSPTVTWADLLVLPKDIDTTELTSNEVIVKNRQHLIDMEFIKNKYCYEQIVSLSLPADKQNEYMLDDLNRYFSQSKNMIGNLEKRRVPCYVLIRNNNRDVLSSKGSGYYLTDTLVNEKGEKNIRLEGWSLGSVLQHVINDSEKLHSLLLQNKIDRKSFLIINETGWDYEKKVAMQIPINRINDISDFRQLLENFGLDIVEQEREINFLVFKKSDYNLPNITTK